MAEQEFIIDRLKLQYEGLFSVYELYEHFHKWFEKKGYYKKERWNKELVKPAGKQIEFMWDPWRTVNDYINFIIQVRCKMTDVQEVEIDVDGEPVQFNRGKIEMEFGCYINADFEGRWETKDYQYFLRVLYNKFIHRPVRNQWKADIAADLFDLHTNIKAFLSLYRYRTEQRTVAQPVPVKTG